MEINQKSKAIKRSHDELTKSALTDIRVAEELFRHYLPAEVTSYIDFNTLRLSTNSFVGQKLQQFFSDIVYEAKVNDQLGFFSIIIEHKSSADNSIINHSKNMFGQAHYF